MASVTVGRSASRVTVNPQRNVKRGRRELSRKAVAVQRELVRRWLPIRDASAPRARTPAWLEDLDDEALAKLAMQQVSMADHGDNDAFESGEGDFELSPDGPLSVAIAHLVLARHVIDAQRKGRGLKELVAAGGTRIALPATIASAVWTQWMWSGSERYIAAAIPHTRSVAIIVEGAQGRPSPIAAGAIRADAPDFACQAFSMIESWWSAADESGEGLNPSSMDGSELLPQEVIDALLRPGDDDDDDR